jgi:polyisoprenyl-teichoic acid--peptidoglycan teichoic acid transferase
MEIGHNRRIVSKIHKWVAVSITAVVLAVAVGVLFFTVRFMNQTGISPMLMISLITNDGITLKSSQQKTNVLLLGIGGGDHEGGDLTDTMIVLSLDRQKKSAALISIPRDTWSDTLKDRINTAYHYGELKQKGGGMILAKAIVEDVIGMPIHYTMLIDFSGFKDIVDMVGGIDVNVSKTFTDTEYPIPGMEHSTCPDDPTNKCVYETVHFDSGLQHMDGDRALIYVRSRHAEGEEGTDFARNRRQQEVLIALKDKIIHPIGWVNFFRITHLFTVLDKAIDADMNIGELATVGKQYLKLKDTDVKKIAFDTLLIEAPAYLYNGMYVLVPKDSWSSVTTYIQDQLQ